MPETDPSPKHSTDPRENLLEKLRNMNIGKRVLSIFYNKKPEAPSGSTGTPSESGASTGESSAEKDDLIKSTSEKLKNNKTVGYVLDGIALATGITVIASMPVLEPNNPKQSSQESPPSSYNILIPTSDSETAETVKGIQDGYDEPGMYLSETKSNPYNFADASVVAEQCDLDEVEMIKYTAKNQVESFADYLANLPPELQPHGFRGLSILETERQIESLSPEEYDALLKYFDSTMDEAFTRRTTVNGKYDNAYMRVIDSSKPITHDNMELVRFSTNENAEYTEFYWKDEEGNPIGSMLVKMSRAYDEGDYISGYSGCMQVLNPKESARYLYEGIPEVHDLVPAQPTPDTGTISGGELPAPAAPASSSHSSYSPSHAPSKQVDEPKNAKNLELTDEKIEEAIAEDIHTKDIKITPTKDVTEVEEATPNPTPEEYHGEEPVIVQNVISKDAEQITPVAGGGDESVDIISPENDYTKDLSSENSEDNLVQPDQAAQAAAISEAPTGGTELSDILSELGIF